jgi:putative FmdB family regulatory protein
MPLYEYECEQCATRFEVIQKFSDPPAQACPSCGGSVRKLLSSPAIQFKGSGWYITDYARKGNSAPAGKTGETKPAASSSAGSGEVAEAKSGGEASKPSSSDTKPAGKE